MSQTTAPRINAELGEVGMIAEAFGPKDIRTGVSQASQLVGRFVSHGSADGEFATPAAAVDITGPKSGGVVCRRLSRVSKDGSADPSFDATESFPVMRKGWVWVKVEDAVTKDTAAFVNFQNGNEGQFRSDADGGNAAQVPSAYFRSAAGAGELALLEIHLP